jgi:DHA3 family macrolide efflux protein-like MFS transporter
MTDYKPLLKVKAFVYLWGSQILSQITIQILNFIFLFRLFIQTGSTIATSFLWISYVLPAIFIGPIGSASIDIFNKRKVLMVTNFLQAALVFLYAFVYKRSVFLLYGATMSYSLLNQFYMPAELASLPTLIKKGLLTQANSLFFITQQVSLIVGFGIAGPLSRSLGFKYSLLICATLLFFAYISVSLLPNMIVRNSMPKKFDVAFLEFFQRIITGYKYIRRNNTIVYPLLLLLGMQVSLVAVAVNVPVIVKELFKVSIEVAGGVLVVSGGLGALYAAVKLPKLINAFRKIRLIETSLIIIVISSILLAFLVPKLNKPYNMTLGILITAALGYAFVQILIPTQTFLQQKTHDNFRGRVLGSYGFLMSIVTIFPVILSGTLTELFGIRVFIIILGIIFFLTYVFINKKGGLLMSQINIK